MGLWASLLALLKGERNEQLAEANNSDVIDHRDYGLLTAAGVLMAENIQELPGGMKPEFVKATLTIGADAGTDNNAADALAFILHTLDAGVELDEALGGGDEKPGVLAGVNRRFDELVAAAARPAKEGEAEGTTVVAGKDGEGAAVVGGAPVGEVGP